MKRILEPEVMDDEKQVYAYAKADFAASNQFFVDEIADKNSLHINHVLDIGCGPGDIPVRLARKFPSVQVTAVDASGEMVKVAKRVVSDVNLEDRITVIKDRLPGLSLENNDFDMIISKDLLHHLPEPELFWQELKRLATGKTAVFVMDLFRPENVQDAKTIVESVSGDELEILKRDFLNSLLAAFSLEEVTRQFQNEGLELSIGKVNERHFLATGFING